MGPGNRGRLSEDTMHAQRGGRQGQGGRSRGGPIPLWVWFLGLIVTLLLLVVCGLWALYGLRGRWAVVGPTPTPIIWTPTPLPVPTATPTPTPVAGATPTVSPEIAVGRYVRVTGTEDSGLSLREGPGENYPRVDIALEGEVFIVIEGPQESAGVVWWRIRDPDGEKKDWWAAGNYLEPIEHP